MSKVITQELINKRLEAKGFGDKQMENDESIREAVLNHFGYKLTDEMLYRDDAEFYIYEESTQDGHSVYITTENPDRISISENVHYYDHDLGDALACAIQYGNGDPEWPETIYIDDLDATFIDEAMQNLFEKVSLELEEEVIDELLDEGYEHEDAEAVA